MRLPDPEEIPLVPLWTDDPDEVSAGRWAQLGRTATFDAAGRGEIPTIRIGRRLLVPVAELRRMVSLDPSPGDELAARRRAS